MRKCTDTLFNLEKKPKNFSEPIFFSLQMTIGSFGVDTSGINSRLATTFVDTLEIFARLIVDNF